MGELVEKLGIDGKLIIAQIVNFTILLFVLKRYVYGPILDLLEKREKSILEAKEFSDNIEQKMIEIEMISQEKVNEGIRKAEQIINQAQERAREKEREITIQAMEKSKKIIDEAKWLAEQEREKIAAELKSEMGSLVVLAAEKIISTGIKPEDLNHLEKEALKFIE